MRHERHVASCEACAREREALGRLTESLRASVDDDEVSLRRLRRATLERAYLEVGAREARSLPAFAKVLVLVAALGAVGLALNHARSQKPMNEAVAFALENPTVVDEEKGASWSRRWAPNADGRGGRETIALGEGALHLAHHESPQGASLLVEVPDGHIEDLGTAFRVVVEGGTTREIDVDEGRILFHRRDGASILLEKGSHWRVERSEPPPVASVAMPPAKPSTSASAPPRRDAPPPASSSVITSSREEDAAYLRVLSLVREGRDEEARVAAAEYLARFPTGFRRLEVERIQKGPTP